MGPIVLLSCALLAAAPPAAPRAAGLPTLSIDLSPLPRPTFDALEQAGIYQGLVVRLVTERVALVDPKEPAELVLRMELAGGPDELLVTARSDAGARSQRVPIRGLEDDGVRLRLVHVAAELVRQVRELPRPPSPPPAAAPAPPRLRPRVALDVGALWSGASAGAVAHLAAATPVGPGELGLAAVLHRPSPGSGLEITEWGLLGVVGTGERAVGPRVRLGAALELGVWQHRWRYAGEAGARLDAAAFLHGEATLRLAPAWRLGVVAGLLFSRAREHRTATATLWRAPGLRPMIGLELGFGREAGK